MHRCLRYIVRFLRWHQHGNAARVRRGGTAQIAFSQCGSRRVKAAAPSERAPDQCASWQVGDRRSARCIPSNFRFGRRRSRTQCFHNSGPSPCRSDGCYRGPRFRLECRDRSDCHRDFRRAGTADFRGQRLLPRCLGQRCGLLRSIQRSANHRG